MGKERDKPSARGRPKHRHRLSCVNHSKTPAVARCEVCGNTICKECVRHYEGARICGDVCWNKKMAGESARISEEERLHRKRKEKKADRAVTVGLWVVLLVVLGVVSAFVYAKISDHSGDKVWEFTNPGGALEVRPHLNSVFLLSADGKMEAFDALAGERQWSVKLPEGTGRPRLLMIDDNRSIACFANKLFLCSSDRAVPAWEFDTPQPSLSAEPVFLDDRLYVASSLTDYYSEMFSRFEESRPADPMSRNRFGTTNEQEEERRFSAISAVDMASGDELWQTELENIRVGGLLANENRVYAAGYQFRDYGYSRYTTARKRKGAEEENDDLASTQLWALNAATGDPEWKLEATGEFLISPIGSSEGIVFSTWENIYLISPDGKVKWKYPLQERFILSFQPHEDKLFVSTGDGFIICIELVSGQKKWMAEVGRGAAAIVVGPQMVYVSGSTRVEHEVRKVRPTKRWEGSEDLLKKALKSSAEVTYEKVLYAIDIESGEKLWSIPKITGDFRYAHGFLYALRYFEWMQFLDATVDPTQISKTVSNLGAYDCLTGEKVWEAAIDGYVSDLRLTQYVAVLKTRSEVFTIGANIEEPSPVRLVGISLD